ncbi:hypothetical protein [Streptomyces marianii]|nr:hypothetical protein [Streptomyces marianii]
MISTAGVASIFGLNKPATTAAEQTAAYAAFLSDALAAHDSRPH